MRPGICLPGSLDDCDKPPAMMLIFGWLTFGQMNHWDIAITWLAHPLIVLAWFFRWTGQQKFAFRLSFCAFVVTVAPLVYGPFLNLENVSGFGFGYWLLVLSIALAAASIVLVDPALFSRHKLPKPT
jgi:hypothetical protein